MHSRPQQRQYTFLSHRPTHFRVKTETDASQQHRSINKHLTFKNPLVSYQTGEFQIESTQKISNVTFIGKKTPLERSLFGEINVHQKLKFKKQSIQTQYHPLNEHINSSSQKKDQRNVKRYKTSCDTQILSHGKKKSPKNLTMTPIKRAKTSFSVQLSKQHEAMFKIIDEIYKKIDKLMQIGFPDKKISQWIQRYCFQKRNYMTDLLMKSISKNKLSQSTQTYFFERDPRAVKQKLLIKKKTINGVQKPIQIYDLAEFSQYVEGILVSKNKSKVLDLRNSISKKLQQCFFYNRETNQNTFGKKLYAPQMLNFMADLDEFERKNGHFNKISNFNRQYFADLGNTEKDIRSKVYELTQLTQGTEKPQRELKKSSTVKLQRRFTRQNTKLIKQSPDEVTEQSDEFDEQNLS